ncbi:hypothetical protein Hypma_015392 [Hypsizygus marmoreus]|uniref:Uncharacterized protein n=1 Tax=Hypsizygus marmoreus TaxID=39966 RepID=A0A369K4K7_HYPMA|nr:hypothetical protein Hypma_015392 [Hypsizygus marmoreus]
MAPLPSRKSLENMKRVDLQKLCKDYGVKANLKSEALIDLLLDSHKPATRNVPMRRSVSTRLSSRAGPSRTSSMIIHNTDDEEDDEPMAEDTPPQEHGSNIETVQSAPTPPATRTRKGKEQTRLGVGRPVAAGGSGPRAVTKSLSVAKGKRGKASKSMKPSEDTIVEEEIEETDSVQQAGNIQVGSPPQEDQATSITSPDASLESLASVDKHVADALRPLHEQMKSLKSELEQMQSLKTELAQLKAQMGDIQILKDKVESLTATVDGFRTQAAVPTTLTTEAEQATANFGPSLNKSPAQARQIVASGLGLRQSKASPLDQPEAGPSTSHLAAFAIGAHPEGASTMLGKRQRDSDSDVLEDEEENVGDESGQKTIQPVRKRAKTGQSPPQLEGQKEEEEEEEETAPRIPSFTVFQGPEQPSDFIDPPPPTDHLPDFFGPPSPPIGSGPSFSRQAAATSTANASENHHPFSFSFLPMSSTPNAMFMPSFPYPEPPQSPSPAGSHPSSLLSQHHGDRTDVFQAFGFPPPGRSSRLGSRVTSGLGGGFVDPAALTRVSSDSDRAGEAMVNIAGTRKGTSTRPTDPSSPSTSATGSTSEAPLMKRTMYGTELDGDTRFGDFGVEGVGNSNGGFWAGGRY